MVFFPFFFLMFISERDTDRQTDRLQSGEGQRERDIESEAGSRLELSAQSPTQGSNPLTGRS